MRNGVLVRARQSRPAMSTSLLDDAAPPGYGAVSQVKAPLLNARMRLSSSISEPLTREDRSVLSFHHVSYTLPQRRFGVITVGRKHILNDLRYVQCVCVCLCLCVSGASIVLLLKLLNLLLSVPPCSGVMGPGLNAIMGPTGGGKTS